MRDTKCMFCREESSEDSIEHFVHCKAIQNLFPGSMKILPMNTIPASHFFLHNLDGRRRLVFALVLYAIYTVHNDFRHSNNHSDFNKCVITSLLDVRMNRQIREAVMDILQL